MRKSQYIYRFREVTYNDRGKRKSKVINEERTFNDASSYYSNLLPSLRDRVLLETFKQTQSVRPSELKLFFERGKKVPKLQRKEEKENANEQES